MIRLKKTGYRCSYNLLPTPGLDGADEAAAARREAGLPFDFATITTSIVAILSKKKIHPKKPSDMTPEPISSERAEKRTIAKIA